MGWICPTCGSEVAYTEETCPACLQETSVLWRMKQRRVEAQLRRIPDAKCNELWDRLAARGKNPLKRLKWFRLMMALALLCGTLLTAALTGAACWLLTL